mgnify:CR=1 FL=1
MGSDSASAVEAGRCFELAMKLVTVVVVAAEAGCDQSETVLAAVVGLASVVRRN